MGTWTREVFIYLFFWFDFAAGLQDTRTSKSRPCLKAINVLLHFISPFTDFGFKGLFTPGWEHISPLSCSDRKIVSSLQKEKFGWQKTDTEWQKCQGVKVDYVSREKRALDSPNGNGRLLLTTNFWVSCILCSIKQCFVEMGIRAAPSLPPLTTRNLVKWLKLPALPFFVKWENWVRSSRMGPVALTCHNANCLRELTKSPLSLLPDMMVQALATCSYGRLPLCLDEKCPCWIVSRISQWVSQCLTIPSCFSFHYFISWKKPSFLLWHAMNHSIKIQLIDSKMNTNSNPHRNKNSHFSTICTEIRKNSTKIN